MKRKSSLLDEKSSSYTKIGQILSLSLTTEAKKEISGEDSFEFLITHQIEGETKQTFVSRERFQALCYIMAGQIQVCDKFHELPHVKLDQVSVSKVNEHMMGGRDE